MTLTPAFDACYPMLGWSGDCSGLGPCEMVLDRGRRARAEFERPTGETRWSREFRTAGGGEGIAVDENDDVFLAGKFLGTVDLGGGVLTGDGAWNGFLSKLSGRDGSHIWSLLLNGSRDSYWASWLGPLGVFPGGDVAVAGGVYGTGSFGPIQVSVDGLLVARCSGADGQPRWLQSWPAPQGALPSVMLTDPLGDIVVAGAYAGPADFGGGPMPQEPGWTAFLAGYAGIDGSHRWSLASPAAEPDVQAAFDREGSIVAAGHGGPDEYAYVTRLAGNDGAVLWRREFRTNNWDLLPAVAIGTGGDIVLAGALQAGADFGGGPMSTGAFVIAWYAHDGTFLRARTFEQAAQAQGRMAVDPHGDIVIAGWFRGTIDFGTGQLTVEGASRTYAAFVAKVCGVDGNALWARRLVDVSLANLAIDQRCNIFTAAYSPVGVLVSKLAP